MSPVWIQLVAVLWLPCATLRAPETAGVKWREIGGSVTIQCRGQSDRNLLTVKRGLTETIVLTKEGMEDPIFPEFQGRLQVHGKFPNVDVLIKNLTPADTGPYWCFYTRYKIEKTLVNEKGAGSLLLVVAGEPLSADTAKQCDPAGKDLVLVSVVISAAVLFGIVIGFLIWIGLKTRSLRRTAKPRRAASAGNDVYEDMRGTLRR